MQKLVTQRWRLQSKWLSDMSQISITVRHLYVLTGPSLWGRAIAASVSQGNEKTLFGDCDELTPHHLQKNKCFIAPNGQLLAECKPTAGGDLTQMGAFDTNNYNVLWHRKCLPLIIPGNQIIMLHSLYGRGIQLHLRGNKNCLIYQLKAQIIERR